jgi:guanylate kinase
VGKNAILRELLKVTPNLKKVITCTTRKRRLKEREGKDHFFVTAERFKKMIKEKKFLEWAYVHRDYYGTPTEAIQKNKKKKLILEIDVQGALQIKKKIPQAVLIFIKPDSLKNLLRRISHRGKMGTQDLEIRIKKSYPQEMELSKFYDYAVVNKEGKLDETVRKVKEIIEKDNF